MNEQTTHYLPAFCRVDRHRQYAVCGVAIEAYQFSTEPTCPGCARWLVDDEAMLQSVIDGPYDPADIVAPRPWFDPTRDGVKR